MAELLLVFVGGLLGSSHCVGMCGAFALTIGAGSRGWKGNLARQGIYTLGRVFTYSIAGATAGFFGLWLMQRANALVQWQAVLAIVAGLLLLAQGLHSVGWLRWPGSRRSGPCLSAGLLRNFLTRPDLGSVFLAGVFTGFLPCGLVYAYLALAASAGQMPLGAARMAAFGLGTAPLLMLVGCGGSLLNLAARQRMLRVAAWCVVVTGVLSIGRGVGFWTSLPAATAAQENSASATTPPPTPKCPFCADKS